MREHTALPRRAWLAHMCGISAGLCLGTARAQETANAAPHLVTWYDYDLPPVSIVSGPQQFQGINNLTLKRLMTALPQYQHQLRVANFARITENMRNGEMAAAVGFQKTPEREQAMQFSVPFTIAMSPSVIVLEGQAQKIRTLIDGDGDFPLEQALSQGTLRVGVASGRSYGPAVNALLEKYKGNASITYRTGNEISIGLIDMLKAQRFDFTIMFPEEAQYLSRQLGDKVSLLSFHIREAPAYASVHVVAPRTPWGTRLIEQVNPIVLKFRDTADFHRERMAWMDEEARKRYKPLVQVMLKATP